MQRGYQLREHRKPLVWFAQRLSWFVTHGNGSWFRIGGKVRPRWAVHERQHPLSSGAQYVAYLRGGPGVQLTNGVHTKPAQAFQLLLVQVCWDVRQGKLVQLGRVMNGAMISGSGNAGMFARMGKPVLRSGKQG